MAFVLLAPTTATLRGDRWEPFSNQNSGELLGFRAVGDGCTVHYAYGTSEQFCFDGELTVSKGQLVHIAHGFLVVPQAKEEGSKA
jgi:hypothetical protein